MKLIQLNTQEFRYFDNILTYLQKEKADIVTMQEVTKGPYGKNTSCINCLDQLRDLGYTVIYGPNYGVMQGTQLASRGNAILSKYPVIHSQQHFFYPRGQYSVKTPEELGWHYDEHTIAGRLKRRAISRSLPCSILECIVQTDTKFVRLLTTHFPPSSKCIETFQMVQMATHIQQLVQYASPIPTILTGDFNLQPPAESFLLLEEYFTHITNQRTNTLDPQLHFGFQNDIPTEGYHVDHIFAKEVICTHRYVDKGGISDHLPVVATFQA